MHPIAPRRIACTLGVLFVLAGGVQAQEVDPAARARAVELFDNGAVLYEEGNYEAAVLAFKQAFDLSHAPALQYNLANCYERLGRLTEARDALDLYRAVAPAEERARLDRRVAALEERMAMEKPPAEAAPTVPPPVAVTAPVVPREPASPPASRGPLKGVLIGVGAGIAAGGGALVGLGFVGAADALTENDRSTYGLNRTVNNVGFGVAGLGLAAAVVGFAIPAGQSVRASALPTDDGLQLALSGQW